MYIKLVAVVFVICMSYEFISREDYFPGGEPTEQEPWKPKPSPKLSTFIHFNGTIICPRANFCATVRYQEIDSFEWSIDYWQYVPLHCTKTHELNHQAFMLIEDGDGPWDNWFEPHLKIYHDCQAPKVFRITNNVFNLINVNEKNVSITYTEYLEGRFGIPRLPQIKEYINDQFTEDKDTTDWVDKYNIYDREHLYKPMVIWFNDTRWSVRNYDRSKFD